MLHIGQFLFAWFFKIFYPTKIIGKQNIPKGGAILASNHTSNLDAVLMAANTWEKRYYLAKKELFQNKMMSFFLKGIGAIKINRENPEVSAIKTCMKVLKNNKRLVIFPEGTRNKSDSMQLGEMKHGVSMFAIKAKVPIVPMFISRRPKIFRRTIITYGEPFELDAFYGKRLDSETLEQAGAIVTEKMEALRESCQNALTK